MTGVQTCALPISAEEAQAYARRWNELGAVEEGTVAEQVIGGRLRYVANMRYHDAMLGTIAEQRMQRLRTTADFEKDYLMGLEDIKRMQEESPDALVMAIPRPTMKRFLNQQKRIDAHLEDTFGTLKKGFGLLGSLFKLLSLSMSAGWVTASVVGSSMMLGLARPEMFPSIMAHMWQRGQRAGAHQLHLACNQINQRLPRALVRHMQHIDARAKAE